MAKENETVAEIIAEMRHKDKARRRFTLTDEYGGYETITIDRANTMLSLADRLEAAHKRERGNVAKLREALSDACYAMFNFLKTRSGGYEEMANALDKAKAALAAPARNCDRFANAVEAMAEMKRAHSYCAKENRRCLEDCPDCGKEWCSLAWLFAPATEKEGGAK